MLHNSCATPFRNGKFIRTIAPDRGTALSPFTFPSSPFPLLKHQHASIRDPRCTAAWQPWQDWMHSEQIYHDNLTLLWPLMICSRQAWDKTAGNCMEGREGCFWHLEQFLVLTLGPISKGSGGIFLFALFVCLFVFTAGYYVQGFNHDTHDILVSWRNARHTTTTSAHRRPERKPNQMHHVRAAETPQSILKIISVRPPFLSASLLCGLHILLCIWFKKIKKNKAAPGHVCSLFPISPSSLHLLPPFITS